MTRAAFVLAMQWGHFNSTLTLNIYSKRQLNLAEYKNLDPRWQNWEAVKTACVGHATLIFDRIVGLGA